MNRRIKRLTALLIMGVLCMTGMTGCQPGSPDTPDTAARLEEITGYQALAPYHMGFIAVGSEGRIGDVDVDTKEATVLPSPTTETLHDVVAYNGQLVAVGNAGTILRSTDGATFEAVASGVTTDLYAVTYWNACYVAAGAGGRVLYSSTGEEWTAVDTGVTDTITGIAGSPDVCLAVTHEGRTLTSTNMTSWTVFEYNTYYEKQTSFSEVLRNDNIFYAVGEDETDGPVITSTLTGEVWMPRALEFYNNENLGVEGLSMYAIAWDGQQLFASCNNGRLYTMPDCTQCNKVEEIGLGDLLAVAYNGGKLCAVGGDFTVAVVDTEAVRQYNISADTALAHQQAGAVIVDVRSRDEYDEKHIAGAVHISLDAVETSLPALYPDKSTELIFYCTKGVRSQTALETAQKLGYTTVYSLGAMDKWTHGFEPAE